MSRTRAVLRRTSLVLLVALLARSIVTLRSGLIWRGAGGGYLPFGWRALGFGELDPKLGEPLGWSLYQSGLAGLSFGPESGPAGWVQIVSLWAPVIALAMATVALWRRPALKGSCPKCRYDHGGLEAGTPCTECGAGR
jgi:hypothetical protein